MQLMRRMLPPHRPYPWFQASNWALQVGSQPVQHGRLHTLQLHVSGVCVRIIEALGQAVAGDGPRFCALRVGVSGTVVVPNSLDVVAFSSPIRILQAQRPFGKGSLAAALPALMMSFGWERHVLVAPW
jgi:hypothetical protein